MNITIFGTGYVGLTTGACLANLGHSVLCVDIDHEKIATLQEGKMLFFEPGLKDLVARNIHKKRLSFTTNKQEGVNFADVIFNCVGTPGKEDGSANLQYVYQVAKDVATLAQGHKVLINKSTVPPGTAAQCDRIIKETNSQSQVEVVSNPEFLAQGKAVHDFTHPDKIVVGAKSSLAFSLLRKVYTGRVRSYIPFLETDWETAEVIKYANNSFLATKISFVNEMANICDSVGADVKLVTQAMGLDYRISPKFLNAGIGYGGSCFPKDVRALAQVALVHGYEAKLLREVDELNTRQKTVFINKIQRRFGKDLSGKVFAIWGLSFKPKTSDTRESPSIPLIRSILQAGGKIQVYDPVAHDGIRKEFGDSISYCTSPESSAKSSDAILLLTEWDEFRNLHFAEIGEQMVQKVLFDGRNIYEPELVKEEGFEYYGIGRR